jgi:hypothetical protein
MATTRQVKIGGQNHILPPLGIENTLIMQSKSIQKQRESAASYFFRKTFWLYECSLFSG